MGKEESSVKEQWPLPAPPSRRKLPLHPPFQARQFSSPPYVPVTSPAAALGLELKASDSVGGFSTMCLGESLLGFRGLGDTDGTSAILPVATKEANMVFPVDLETPSSHLRSARVRVL
ncbi:uncharacterized protein RBU33_014518 isoform 1-T3 [Hipposideros larvatus]